MAFRTGPPLREQASTSAPALLAGAPSATLRPGARARNGLTAVRAAAGGKPPGKASSSKTQATAEAAAPLTAQELGEQQEFYLLPVSELSDDEYEQLVADDGLADVDWSAPAPPRLLKFCRTGEEELRLMNYSINGALVGAAALMAGSQLWAPGGGVAHADTLLLALHGAARQGWQAYEAALAAHPVLTKALISGAVYGLGDFTAQTYEGRSWREFDPARVARSAACGCLVHGPLSHLFYERLDRAVILSPYFGGGDAWYAPLAKVAVDQTAFALTWNCAYYLLLGAMKRDPPSVIAASLRASWWQLLKAGWRVWPVVHLATYTLIPLQHRLLWVDCVELSWVTILCIYGQQRRARGGLAACALPGTAGEGGGFTEDILRGMAGEQQIVFQSGDDAPIIKRLETVVVDAARTDANVRASGDWPAAARPRSAEQQQQQQQQQPQQQQQQRE